VAVKYYAIFYKFHILYKVKIRHMNDAVRCLYCALINHERDTDMMATTVNGQACQPSQMLNSLKSRRTIHSVMPLNSSDFSHERDMTKENVNTLGLIFTTRRGLPVSLF